MILYDYFRSSASYRVRIVMHLKGIPFDTKTVSLLEKAHQTQSYQALNPAGLIPCLDVHGEVLSQSLAMIDYLDTLYPKPALYPVEPLSRAQVKSIMLLIACDIHPLNNLRVREYLSSQAGMTEETIRRWVLHWLNTGFDSLETQLKTHSNKKFCFGNSVSGADVCLIPQVYSALRFELPLEKYPTIQAIYEHCQTLVPFKQAHPDAC